MRVETKKRHTFSLAASDAQEVWLAGQFTEWDQHPVRLKKGKDGIWKAKVMLEPGSYEYRFLVDGQWCNDPECSARVRNDFGSENCVCVIAPVVERQRVAT